ncbi:MAG: hypothetical protein GKR91_05035 [Pseudomonadales bacterium]|nr:hypothetical protein [Pseudomonadales bacterium]
MRTKAFFVTLLCFFWPAMAAEKTLKDGIFTEAQAERGQIVYGASCEACHNVRDYRAIMHGRANQSLIDFWYQIVAEMPSDNPGFLSDQEYTDVVAYILSAIGFEAGDTELDPNNGMESIKIVSPYD